LIERSPFKFLKEKNQKINSEWSNSFVMCIQPPIVENNFAALRVLDSLHNFHPHFFTTQSTKKNEED